MGSSVNRQRGVDMEPAFQELIQSLEAIQAIYKQMAELAEKKQQELVKGNLEQIDALTKDEEKLIYLAGRLEDERSESAGRLIAHFQLQKDATLKDIMDIAPEGLRSKLQTIQESMGELIARMDKLNQENIALIRQSLRFINFTVDLLSKPEDPATYSAGSEKGPKQDSISRILDQKV